MTTKKRNTNRAKTAKKTPPKSKSAKTPAKQRGTASTKPSSSSTKRDKRPSALDAAAQVLARSKEPLSCGQLIERMAEQGLWKSPGGATPDRTLYSAMLREIATKGKDSRFVRVQRGRFARKA